MFVSQRIVPAGSLTAVYDDATKYNVGERVLDENGNEYIFLKGVAFTVAGSWVIYDEDGVTTLLGINQIGPVGIAQAAIVANKYGFYMLFGSTTLAQAAGAIADNGNLYATATAGAVDDAIVAGDRVKNAIARSAAGGAGAFEAQVWFPFMDDGLAA